MNDKRKRFCEEYVIDCDATKAAIRSGYTAKSAQKRGSDLVNNPECVKYIRHLQTEIAERNMVTADMVVQELAKVAFMNIQEFVNVDNSVKSVRKIKREIAAAIVGVETTSTKTKNGTTKTVKLKFGDKVNALMLLGKHTGAFEKDNNQRQMKFVIKGK